MIAWLKRHYLLLIIGFIIVILLYGAIDGQIAKYRYKKKIREKDASISELWQKIGDSQRREESWIRSSDKNYALAMEKEAKLRKRDQEMRVKIAEKRELKKKIREMPATQVVVRTIEIIQCDEVQKQEQGIVFSLSCAKDNLTVLEDSFSLKREVDDWREQYSTSQAEVVDLKNVIIDKDGVIAERGIQLNDKDEIIEDWKGKFTLSEKRGKWSWWKGLKTGGIAGFFLGFFLGK